MTIISTDTDSRHASSGRAHEQVFADAVRVLTEAARLRRPQWDGAHEAATATEPIDFGEFTSLALAATAANVGGIEELLAGRPGSWEADGVRGLLTSTVGWDAEQLWEHRTEPLVITVPVDAVLAEIGLWQLYEESERAIEEMVDAVGPTSEGGLDQELTAEQEDRELERLADLRDSLDRLQEADWAAYGEAFKASVLAELAREPLPGLEVPVEFHIDARPWLHDSLDDDNFGGPLARLYEAGWLNTPLPGSGIALRDYPPGTSVVEVERAAGRMPHLRLLAEPVDLSGQSS